MPSKPASPSYNASDQLAPATLVYAITESAGATALAELVGGHSAAITNPNAAALFGDDLTWGRYFAPDGAAFAQVDFAAIGKGGLTLAIVSAYRPATNAFQAAVNGGGADGYVYTGINDVALGTRGTVHDAAVTGSFVAGGTIADPASAPFPPRTRMLVISGANLLYYVGGVLVDQIGLGSVPTGTISRLAIGALSAGALGSTSPIFLVALIPRACTLADAAHFEAIPYGLISAAVGTLPIVTGSGLVNESGGTVEWRYAEDITYQPGNLPTISYPGHTGVALASGLVPLGRLSGARRAFWRIPDGFTVPPGVAVTLSVPNGTYKGSSNALSAPVVDLAITNGSGTPMFDGVARPTVEFRHGVCTTPPYYFSDDVALCDLLCYAEGVNTELLTWEDPYGGTVILDAAGLPQSIAGGNASSEARVEWGYSGQFEGGNVDVTWTGTGEIQIQDQGGGERTKVGEDLASATRWRRYTVPSGQNIFIALKGLPVANPHVYYPGTLKSDHSGPTQTLNPKWISHFPGVNVWRTIGAQDPNNTYFPSWSQRTPDGYVLGMKFQKLQATIASFAAEVSPAPFWGWVGGPKTIVRVTCAAPHPFVTGHVDLAGTGGVAGTGGIDGLGQLIRVENATQFTVALYGSNAYPLASQAGTASIMVKPGMSFAQICQIANAAGWDVWYQVNHLADDATVASIGDYFARNLDGKVHVEYSNEVWNNQFLQSQYAMGQGMQSILSPTGNVQEAGIRFAGRRAGQVHTAFRDAWIAAGRGGADCMRVLAMQAGNIWTIQTAYDQLHSVDGRTVEFISPAMYFGLPAFGLFGWPPDLNGSVGNFVMGDPAAAGRIAPQRMMDYIGRDMDDTIDGEIAAWSEYSNSIGVPIAVYEANMHSIRIGSFEGLGYAAGTDQAVVDLAVACNRTAAMGRAVNELYNRMAAAGWTVACFLGSVGIMTPYPWYLAGCLQQVPGDGAANESANLLFAADNAATPPNAVKEHWMARWAAARSGGGGGRKRRRGGFREGGRQGGGVTIGGRR